MRQAVSFGLLVIVCLVCSGSSRAADIRVKPTFTLWQLPEQTHSQMMSYVIRTVGGKAIVIDGGVAGDAPYLRGFLAALGNRVDVWIISHQHDDHFGALGEILKQPKDLEIGRIYSSTLDPEWIQQHCGEGEYKSWMEFVGALRTADQRIIELRLGGRMDIDGVNIEVLGVVNPEIHPNGINNSSLVLRVWDSVRSILFLGDLGPEGGEKLLKGTDRDRLDCDYVQMAHHGQNGVNLDVYQAASPRICLWPTPAWLWDNNIGGKGKGSGPWRTLEVRAWMEQLGVGTDFVSADGLHKID